MNRSPRDSDSRPAEPEAAGFVLAGGQSSRMGRDKALLPFLGRPLAAHALSILKQAGLNGAIAGAQADSRSTLASFAPVVDDPAPNLGPLAGICAALASTSARLAVFLPVDFPLLPPSLIAYLLHHARISRRAVTVPAVSGFTQTFPAVLDRFILPELQIALDSRQGGCFSAFQAAAQSLGQSVSTVAVELLAQSGHAAHPLALPPVHWFLNVNTPEDLKRAEALVAQGIA